MVEVKLVSVYDPAAGELVQRCHTHFNGRCAGYVPISLVIRAAAFRHELREITRGR